MKGGHLNKCVDCTKYDNKTSNGSESRICVICSKNFKTTITEVKRGGAFTCSRGCYYERFRKIVKRDEQSPNWKGNNVGVDALHNWVKKKLGRPKKCEHCGSANQKQYDWANKSQKYRRDVHDWIRLCRSCHAKYDYPTRFPKWRDKVIKLGWNITKRN